MYIVMKCIAYYASPSLGWPAGVRCVDRVAANSKGGFVTAWSCRRVIASATSTTNPRLIFSQARQAPTGPGLPGNSWSVLALNRTYRHRMMCRKAIDYRLERRSSEEGSLPAACTEGFQISRGQLRRCPKRLGGLRTKTERARSREQRDAGGEPSDSRAVRKRLLRAVAPRPSPGTRRLRRPSPKA